MKIQWHFTLITALIYILFAAIYITSVSTFLFREKYIHHLVNDPYQVKKDNVTIDNLFSWLNMKNHIKFKLWTRKNPKWVHEIRIGNLESLRTSNFDARRLTKVIVHGYAHSANEIYLEDWMVSLRDAYLRLADLNILIIDYTLFALPMFYWSAAPDLAAEQLTEMIKFLVQNGVLLESLHILGFSWGAHVAGIAGSKVGGKIGRITGLDPAQPTFRLVDNSKRLDKSDALFVDIIHTNGGRKKDSFMEGHLGLGYPLGHADYYPNSGRAQPGCPRKWTKLYEEIECDHARSVSFFAESIVSPMAFPACRCDSWSRYVKGICTCNEEDIVNMGEHSVHSARGKFYLFTRDRSPYGLGPNLNISLPDIDKYDPDWNNTGYHHHILPFFKKNESQSTATYLPFASSRVNATEIESKQIYPVSANVSDRDHQSALDAQWKPMQTIPLRALPNLAFTYVIPAVPLSKGPIAFKRESIPGLQTTIENTKAAHDTYLPFKKEYYIASVPQPHQVKNPPHIENQASFTQKLFKKIFN